MTTTRASEVGAAVQAGVLRGEVVQRTLRPRHVALAEEDVLVVAMAALMSPSTVSLALASKSANT